MNYGNVKCRNALLLGYSVKEESHSPHLLLSSNRPPALNNANQHRNDRDDKEDMDDHSDIPYRVPQDPRDDE